MNVKAFLCIVLFIGMTSSLFAETEGGGGFMYTRADGKIIIDGYNNTLPYTRNITNLTIPRKIRGMSVTNIRNRAFSAGGKLFTSVTFPDSLTTIGSLAFNNNLLTTVTIPSSVTSIGEGAFDKNPITSVTIPDNVDIQPSSFYALLYEHYMANNKKTYTYTFSRSTSGEFEIVVFNGAVEIIGYNGAGNTHLVIPDKINNLPVTAIGSNAFEDKKLTGVTIPNSITIIGYEAFSHNKLYNITLPNTLTVIGTCAFSFCGLGNVTIPESVKILGGFDNNHMTSIIIPNSVITILPGAFSGNYYLTNIVIPSNEVTIGERAFGERGDNGIDLTIYFKVYGLHSGVYTWQNSSWFCDGVRLVAPARLFIGKGCYLTRLVGPPGNYYYTKLDNADVIYLPPGSYTIEAGYNDRLGSTYSKGTVTFEQVYTFESRNYELSAWTHMGMDTIRFEIGPRNR
jgi:hypothetical protein